MDRFSISNLINLDYFYFRKRKSIKKMSNTSWSNSRATPSICIKTMHRGLIIRRRIWLFYYICTLYIHIYYSYSYVKFCLSPINLLFVNSQWLHKTQHSSKPLLASYYRGPDCLTPICLSKANTLRLRGPLKHNPKFQLKRTQRYSNTGRICSN